jgi:hypothetical protein
MPPIERRRALLGLTALAAASVAMPIQTCADQTPVQLYAPMTVRPALDAVLLA